jgi:ribosomal protein L11 methylase PrmA
VRRLGWEPAGTEWGDYYDATNYSSEGQGHKAELVAAFLDRAKPASVWDLGANTGLYSRLALDRGAQVVSWDVDPAAVEKNYLQLRSGPPRPLLPLLLDLTNPSAAIGWANEERMSLEERGPVDLAMALALVHHLAISNNVPLAGVAKFLAGIARTVILEWVPKQDSQVQRLLATREDIFEGYTQEGLERALEPHFEIVASEPIRDSSRILYLLKRR